MIVIKRFLLSILVGIFNITPGLSGSCLLIIFNLYSKCLEAISNIFKDFKKSFTYLFPIGLGILIGTVLFSNVIFYLVTNYKTITYLVFASFIFATLPSLFKTATKEGFKITYIIPFLTTFTIGLFLMFWKVQNVISMQEDLFLQFFIIGLILAFSTIIPGISGTVIFNILGVYEMYLQAIKSLNFKFLIPMGLGLLIGGFILSKILTLLLKKYYGYTYFAILGFTISTLPILLFNVSLSWQSLVWVVPVCVGSFILARYFLVKVD